MMKDNFSGQARTFVSIGEIAIPSPDEEENKTCAQFYSDQLPNIILQKYWNITLILN